MDPSTLVTGLDPDEPFYDMLYDDIDTTPQLLAFVAEKQTHFDIELMAADQSDNFWVRVTPTLCAPNDDYPDNYRIEDGACQRLNDHGQPVGAIGSCNGYFTTRKNPGHTVGKLDINIPTE